MQPGPRPPSKPPGSFSGFAPKIQKQPTQPIGPGAQQPNNPPIVPIAPEPSDVQAALDTAKQLLLAAREAVQKQIEGTLYKCGSQYQSGTTCIANLIRDALASVYEQYGTGATVISDNLAYLMSAAQQYAAQLGYPPVPVDVSQLPPEVRRDLTSYSQLSPLEQGKQSPLVAGTYTVVPRSVGWETGQYPVPPEGTLAQPSGARLDYLNRQVDTGVPLPEPLTIVQPIQPSPPVSTAGFLLPSGGVTVPTPGAAGYPSPGVPPTVPQPLGVAAGGLPSVGATPGLTVPSAGLSQEGPIFRGRNVASTLTETPSGEVSLIPPAQTGAITSLGAGVSGAIAGGVGTPLDTGCPTSLVGLPTIQQLDLGQILPAPGMWITDGVCAYQMGTYPDPQGRKPVTSNFPLNGVDYYGYLDPACPCNYGKTAVPIVQPAPPAPIPVQSCDNLPPNQANWTPWQIANCYQAPVTVSTCPAPVVTCPAPVVSMNMTELCNCLKALVINQLPVPVDLDEPLAFKLAPDDVSWKANALAFSGKWLADYNGQDTADDFRKDVFKDYPATVAQDYDSF